ncbi:MAG TPA: DUF739 family protein [Methylomusa anaerophila]|uniref:HTH cro/C1-type domain-containing protein n=1 Tax=Methylomusa anaerophila TaxID=1930071 RepID=A0A348AIW9_9FIRM|nr:DUF739 family protein [Methylomusa anaerophila]BBB91017.1 hypothetical protein MAMMFC1_01685 [Methylomusa anaerophila]HML88888.1 DUF739 family protein [Methylomusa anaerophila]
MSFLYNKLKGKIKEKFGTQEAFAKKLGISRTSLSLKLNNFSEFTQKEILDSMALLGLPGIEVDKYFFTLKVQKTEQNDSELKEVINE